MTVDAALTATISAAVSAAIDPLHQVVGELRAELSQARSEIRALHTTVDQLSTQPTSELVYLSLHQVADRVGVSLRTVRRWIRDGRLPYVRLPSGSIRISVLELERLIRSLAARPGADDAGAAPLSIHPQDAQNDVAPSGAIDAAYKRSDSDAQD